MRSLNRQLLVLYALLLVAACVLLNWFVLGRVPHGWDEAAYLFQARIFSCGRFVAPGTVFPELFWTGNTILNNRYYYSMYPPGWPALLAPAVFIGAPALANAVLAGICAALVWVAGRVLFGVREAWAAALLAGLSPFYLFMGASGLSHMSCAAALTGCLCASLYSVGEDKNLRSRLGWAVLAAGCAGLALLIRPYSAVIGLMGTALVVVAHRRHWRLLVQLIVCIVTGLLAAVAVAMLYNLATTGHPLLTAYKVRYPNLGFLGFDHQAGGLMDNLRNNWPKIARGYSTRIWGWPFADVWPVAAAVVLRWSNLRVRGLLAAILVFALGQSAYFYFDFYYGPRLIFETLPWVFVLSGCGVVALADLVRTRLPRRTASALMAIAVGVVLLGSLAGFAGAVRYYSRNYCGQGGEVLYRVRSRIGANALVFVKSPESATYANFAFLNNIEPGTSPQLFVRDVPQLRSEANRAFPRAECWLAELDLDPLMGPDGYADRFLLKDVKLSRLK